MVVHRRDSVVPTVELLYRKRAGWLYRDVRADMAKEARLTEFSDTTEGKWDAGSEVETGTV